MPAISRIVFGLFCCLLATAAFAAPEAGQLPPTVREYPGRLRLSYDQLSLPGNENMGLAGASYLFDLNQNLYAGLSVYGAVAGHRGGFFTGGFEFGGRFPLTQQLDLDTGLFFGGGGGGAAPQGGGMMLRPHLGVDYDFGSFILGAAASYVRFPNGDIDSGQLSISFEKRFRSLFGGGWSTLGLSTSDINRLSGSRPIGISRREFALTSGRYRPAANSHDTTGAVRDSSFGLVGFAARIYSADYSYLQFSAAAAATGGRAGYAEIFVGPGYRFRYGPHAGLRVGAAFGAGGGGMVDTGGGIMTRLDTAFDYRFDNNLALSLGFGYVLAPQGDFRARTAELDLAYLVAAPDLHPPAGTASADLDFKPRHWRVSVLRESYYPRKGTRRIGGQIDEQRVDLVGLRADRMLGDHLFISGSAMGAYDGGAGGYATGLVGVGWYLPLFPDQSLGLNAEIQAGAGGGGGMSVGGGIIVQPMLSVEYAPNSRLSFSIGGGSLKAPHGDLQASVLQLGVSYRFTTLEQ